MACCYNSILDCSYCSKQASRSSPHKFYIFLTSHSLVCFLLHLGTLFDVSFPIILWKQPTIGLRYFSNVTIIPCTRNWFESPELSFFLRVFRQTYSSLLLLTSLSPWLSITLVEVKVFILDWAYQTYSLLIRALFIWVIIFAVVIITYIPGLHVDDQTAY